MKTASPKRIYRPWDQDHALSFHLFKCLNCTAWHSAHNSLTVNIFVLMDECMMQSHAKWPNLKGKYYHLIIPFLKSWGQTVWATDSTCSTTCKQLMWQTQADEAEVILWIPTWDPFFACILKHQSSCPNAFVPIE